MLGTLNELNPQETKKILSKEKEIGFDQKFISAKSLAFKNKNSYRIQQNDIQDNHPSQRGLKNTKLTLNLEHNGGIIFKHSFTSNRNLN